MDVFCKKYVLEILQISRDNCGSVTFTEEILKGTVMQIEKALINDRIRASKVS